MVEVRCVAFFLIFIKICVFPSIFHQNCFAAAGHVSGEFDGRSSLIRVRRIFQVGGSLNNMTDSVRSSVATERLIWIWRKYLFLTMDS